MTTNKQGYPMLSDTERAMVELTEAEVNALYPNGDLKELTCRVCGAEEVHSYALDLPEDFPWDNEDICDKCAGIEK